MIFDIEQILGSVVLEIIDPWYCIGFVFSISMLDVLGFRISDCGSRYRSPQSLLHVAVSHHRCRMSISIAHFFPPNY
jgi:hypothetical protein